MTIRENIIVAAFVRCVSWLYSMPNPQVETYFRDLRNIRESDNPIGAAVYYYEQQRDETTPVPLAKTPAGLPLTSSTRLLS